MIEGRRRIGPIAGGLALAAIVVVSAGLLARTERVLSAGQVLGAGPRVTFGMMGGQQQMMGSRVPVAGDPGPGEPGFVPGTVAEPRVVRVLAGPGYIFRPSEIAVAPGETVTFAVTSMGGLVHEFMVGPADAVAADTEGTPEVADIAMMETKTLTYTFSGPGPYAFACHAPGHYESGMRGTIRVVG